MSAHALHSNASSQPNALGEGVLIPPSMRVNAQVMLEVSGASGSSRIVNRHEAGAMRLRFPHGAAHRTCEATLVNIAGGLAGGDHVSLALTAREGASLTLTSVGAERVYRSDGATTETEIALSASASTLLWLPQETIVQDGARLTRRISMDMDGASTLLFGEVLMFGRMAMGERLTHGALRESWRVRREGQLIFADETRMEGAFGDSLTHPATLGRANGMATILLAMPDAGERLEALRLALADHAAVEGGASDLSRDDVGLVFLRLLGEDGMALRAAFRAALDALNLPLPRLLLT
jgi:urease accessory protein